MLAKQRQALTVEFRLDAIRLARSRAKSMRQPTTQVGSPQATLSRWLRRRVGPVRSPRRSPRTSAPRERAGDPPKRNGGHRRGVPAGPVTVYRFAPCDRQAGSIRNTGWPPATASNASGGASVATGMWGRAPAAS